MSLTAKLVDWLIARAARTPYWHLHHGDGSLYMERFWLMRKTWPGISARLHHISTPDYDRELHDHPWDFMSIVLRGGYTEARPVQVEPCFDGPLGEECCRHTLRRPGSIAYRRATDRHRIVSVMEDTWTLFITWPKRQWWGFYTPAGKVHWRDYESVHNNAPAAGGAREG